MAVEVIRQHKPVRDGVNPFLMRRDVHVQQGRIDVTTMGGPPAVCSSPYSPYVDEEWECYSGVQAHKFLNEYGPDCECRLDFSSTVITVYLRRYASYQEIFDYATEIRAGVVRGAIYYGS